MLVVAVEPNARAPEKPRDLAANHVRNNDHRYESGDDEQPVFGPRRRQRRCSTRNLKRTQDDSTGEYSGNDEQQADERTSAASEAANDLCAAARTHAG